MRSSESTPNPLPDASLRRYILVLGDDHPKACTGRRLLHRGLALLPPAAGRRDRVPVVLDPFSSEVLSRADRPTAERGGVLAVDCSWNRLSDRGPGGFGGRFAARGGRHRRLPLLVATNPQHYGRVGELNTAEALSAALYLLGDRPGAEHLLGGFAGASAFFDVNRARLERFSAARSSYDARGIEREIFGSS